MRTLTLTLAAAGLLALGTTVSSCSSKDEDAGASVVNVEKGAAPAVAVPELPAQNSQDQQLPVGIVGAQETATAQEATAAEATETEKDATQADGDNRQD